MEEIVASIKSSQLYIDFMECADKVENHQRIKDIISRIKQLQKQRVNSNFLEKEEFTKKLTNEIDQLHNELDSIPLYCSYIELKEELESIVGNVSVAIENSINKDI